MKVERNSSSANHKPCCYAMHLPIHATLPDGTHVTIDAMTDPQISDMYDLIISAAMSGNGFGVDEYPKEKDFRNEIKGGHNFIVCRKDCGKMVAAFSLIISKFYRGTDIKVVDPIIVVRRSERGRGIGELIFRHVVLFSKRLGFSGIYTDTFSNNVAMTKIIERAPGFQRVGHFPMGGKMPDGTLVGANLYFKDLRNASDDNTFR